MTSALHSVADAVLRLRPGARVLVGIDGVDASGKTTFAGHLARLVEARGRPVVTVHLDDFLNPSAVRHARGRHSAEGFWLDSYDYDAFRSDVLAPLLPGRNGRIRLRSFDLVLDRARRYPEVPTPPNAVVVVEGMFLHRDGLAEVWDHSVFLDVPFSETVRRMAERDGSPADPRHPRLRRYVDGQRRYFEEARPWERATVVIDNTDVERPAIIDASRAGPAR